MKQVAALVTSFWRMSHAEVIVGRLLEGYFYEGERVSPRVRVAALYVDQFPDNDMSRDKAARHDVPIYGSIQEALHLGGDSLAVDGVVIVGEHGVYPYNIKGQEIYPRFHFFQQVVDVFRDSGRSVPVFCDKHLSHDWEEAKWMVDMSRAMGFGLMAGSSLPVAWREPEIELDMETPVQRAVAINYGPKERYGIHTLEALQCMVERRRGGETGIAAVQCLEGEHVWSWTTANPWAQDLLDTALAQCPERKQGELTDLVDEPILFLLDYRSGLQAACYLLNGCIRSAAFAADVEGRDDPVAVHFITQARPHGHFSGLVHHLEELMLSGRVSWPVERTLLTTGALAAVYDSSWDGGRLVEHGQRVSTPHLHIAYRAAQASLFQRGPLPSTDPDFGIGP